MRKNTLARTLLAGAAALSLTLTTGVPAQAQLVVKDPTNYAQNVLQAARALDQINNQIQSLTNEAQMLVNQARNLASLPYSSLQQLQRSVQRTQSLLQQAQRVAYDVQDIDRAFTTTYGAAGGQSNEAMLRNARERWATSVGALQDALRVQAGVVGNIDTNRAEMQALVTSSQSATGALQATQAGNQLLALQAQQLADLTAAVAAQGRAQALEAAERQAAADQGREQRRRFLAPGRGYQPHDVRMFGQ
ncbi:MAG TPA: P-type conjugative transfer protein TrbJ [Sphingomonadaceae bacterium]|nr:P-type conjugative transfer protein TrbJ [Sphingomonadaceae bacterium]